MMTLKNIRKKFSLLRFAVDFFEFKEVEFRSDNKFVFLEQGDDLLMVGKDENDFECYVNIHFPEERGTVIEFLWYRMMYLPNSILTLDDIRIWVSDMRDKEYDTFKRVCSSDETKVAVEALSVLDTKSYSKKNHAFQGVATDQIPTVIERTYAALLDNLIFKNCFFEHEGEPATFLIGHESIPCGIWKPSTSDLGVWMSNVGGRSEHLIWVDDPLAALDHYAKYAPRKVVYICVVNSATEAPERFVSDLLDDLYIKQCTFAFTRSAKGLLRSFNLMRMMIRFEFPFSLSSVDQHKIVMQWQPTDAINAAKLSTAITKYNEQREKEYAKLEERNDELLEKELIHLLPREEQHFDLVIPYQVRPLLFVQERVIESLRINMKISYRLREKLTKELAKVKEMRRRLDQGQG